MFYVAKGIKPPPMMSLTTVPPSAGAISLPNSILGIKIFSVLGCLVFSEGHVS